MHLGIIGGGPAGLWAAETALREGARVTLFEAKASVGRKFLVAGTGGLNLSKAEAPSLFATRYRGPEMPVGFWGERLAELPLERLQKWAEGLGVETFAASTGRVYPREMKAAPLLRRWVERLRRGGVELHMRHRWVGVHSEAGVQLRFATSSGEVSRRVDAVVLALGGGSWPETGADGGWIPVLQGLGVPVAPLAPANCGWELPWPPAVLAFEGAPLKNIAVRAGGAVVRGELLITRYGLEGGAVYLVGAALRQMANPFLELDLRPDLTVPQLVAKMGPARRNLVQEAQARWRLTEAAAAVLRSAAGEAVDPEGLARLVKAVPLPLTRPRPLAEAISSAGGIPWAEVDSRLMLKRLPGVFVAGEMVDWEAPTGGYLIHGCMAMGEHAARGAVQWMRAQIQPPALVTGS